MSAAWFLVGCTASGKTAVADALARRLGATVVSADSMLVYRGMDVGTAKPTPAERAGVDLRCLDLADPDEPFSAGRWLAAARAALAEAGAAGRDAIVAGGTGLYVSALLRGLDASAADPGRRAELEALLEREGLEALAARAEALEAGSTARIDARNPRRLVRLVEILEDRTGSVPHAEPVSHAEFAESAGSVPSTFSTPSTPSTPLVGLEPRTGSVPRAEPVSHAEFAESAGSVPSTFSTPSTPSTPLVGLDFPAEALNERIGRRARAMFEGGLLEEVRGLCERFPGFERSTAGAGIGYAEALAVLRGGLSVDEAVERTALRTRRLAKKQRTWWRHQARVEWVPGPVDEADVLRAARDVLALWRKHGKVPVAP